jgi:hypothetical protein
MGSSVCAHDLYQCLNILSTSVVEPEAKYYLNLEPLNPLKISLEPLSPNILGPFAKS